MFKWFLLFLILTVAVGSYWLVMSGTWYDRAISMELRAAIKEPTVSGIVQRLQVAQERIDGQEALVTKLGFLARNPDWSHVKTARREMARVLAIAQRMADQAQPESETDLAQSLHEQVRGLESLTVQTFYPPQRTFWTVLFWAFAVPTLLFALLSVVRAAPR